VLQAERRRTLSLIIHPSKELEAALKLRAQARGLDAPEHARRLIERALGIGEARVDQKTSHSNRAPT
jgi:hypothetical protein